MGLVEKLSGVRDLKRILETTVKEMGETYGAASCQIMLSNPLDPNVTLICEYRASKEDPPGLPSVTLPLVLHGRTFGAMSLRRPSEVNQAEINSMRVMLGEIGDIIRHAQINDVVQRDTFRDTFLVEIGNVMAYSLGIGDALFMVVNILGKVLQASRCLFICTDDTQAGWKCYEFWQQDKVQSCQDYRWPTTDSPLVAQVLLSPSPLRVFEGQQNSYVSPVQEELQFIGVRSLLGVPLRSSEATHGCVILQQCDYRRAWTRGEIDMVQNVADKVADALVKLPAEKRAREPIMQLHQRIVQHDDAAQVEVPKSTLSVRNALKGALGQQVIQTARKTSQPAIPPSARAAEVLPVQPPAMPVPTPQASPPPPQPPAPPQPLQQPALQSAPQQQVPPMTPPPSMAPPQDFAPDAGQGAQPTISAVRPTRPTGDAEPPSKGTETAAELPVISAADQMALKPSTGSDPYADLDFGEFTDFSDFNRDEAQKAAQAARSDARSQADATWVLDSAAPSAPAAQPSPATSAPIAVPSPLESQFQSPPPVPGVASGAPPNLVPQPDLAAPPQSAQATDVSGEANKWADLDSIPTPSAAAAPSIASAWGDLDSIPTPSAGSARGIGGAILGRPKGPSSAAASSPLLASLHRDKSKFQASAPAPPQEPPPEYVEGPPIQIDEVQAQAKLKQILSSANPTSDYIFATPGLDARMLGRIDGWVAQIEQKDKYANGHARQVAEYATAIAAAVGLSQKEIDVIRQAALVHDVGKLGAAAQILQKRDEELSDPELITVMKHPLDGAELLESFPDLAHLAPIVRAHHEEYDGNGYPQGLKGDEIPVAARIIHIADSYHAMTSPKRFGAGRTPQEAQQELVNGAGKQWDPTFVQALIQCLMAKKVPEQF